MQFCHLHTHTEYSLLDGEASIKNLLQELKNLAWIRVPLPTTAQCTAWLTFIVKQNHREYTQL